MALDHSCALRCVTGAVLALVLLAHASSAGEWTDWEWVDPWPQGYDLHGVAANDEVVVAVGEYGAALVSGDGVDWEITRPWQEDLLFDVTWARDRFIAVGTHRIMTSTDGREWTESLALPVPGWVDLRAVIWTGTEALAVGGPGVCYTSPDGEVWEEHALANLPLAIMEDVATDGSRFVAVGTNALGDERAVFVSEDGRQWELVSEGLPWFGYEAIAWGEGLFVAVGGLWPGIAGVMVSEDGQEWTRVAVGGGGGFEDVSYVNGRFAAVGTGGAGGLLVLSDDGWSWSRHDPGTTVAFGAVAGFDGELLVVGAYGLITITRDGLQWNQVSRRSFDMGSNQLTDIARSDDGVYVAVGDGFLGRSTDGELWEATDEAEHFVTVRWIDGAFWATGWDHTGRIVATGSDGEHWEVIQGAEPLGLWSATDVVVAGETVVAVGSLWAPSGDGMSQQAAIASKRAGEDWVRQIFAERGHEFTSVIWSGKRFFAASYPFDGVLMTSYDGLSWFPQDLGIPIQIRWLESNGERVVGAGLTERGVTVIVSSTDGDVWLRSFQDLPVYVYDITWTGSRFVGVGAWGVLTSDDGLYWNVDIIGAAGGARAAAGDESTIYTVGGWGYVSRAAHVSVGPRSSEGRAGPGGSVPPRISIGTRDSGLR